MKRSGDGKESCRLVSAIFTRSGCLAQIGFFCPFRMPRRRLPTMDGHIAQPDKGRPARVNPLGRHLGRDVPTTLGEST